MAKMNLVTLGIAILLLSGCLVPDASRMTVSVLNKNSLGNTGALEIKVCRQLGLSASDLAVTLYVTENKAWDELSGEQAYDIYFNRGYISFPGTISRALPTSLWSTFQDGCVKARIDDLFQHTESWVQLQMCPFKAIIVVASYQRGTYNAAESFPCQVN
jgi:hypothetical protein